MKVSPKELTNNRHWQETALRKFEITKNSNMVYKFSIDATYSAPDNKSKIMVMRKRL